MAEFKRDEQEVLNLTQTLEFIMTNKRADADLYDKDRKLKDYSLTDINKQLRIEHTPKQFIELLIKLELWERYCVDPSQPKTQILELCKVLFSTRDKIKQDVKLLVSTIEPFLRVIHSIVYHSIICDYNNEQFDCATGQCITNAAKSEILYARHFLGLDRNLVFSRIEAHGRCGICDNSKGIVNRLAETFRIVRNNLFHGEPITNIVDDDEWEWQSKVEFGEESILSIIEEEKAEVIYALLLLVVHVLDYRYQYLYDFVSASVDKLDLSALDVSPEQTTKIAIDYIKQQYIPYITNLVTKKLRIPESQVVALNFTPSNELFADKREQREQPNGAVPMTVDKVIDYQRIVVCGTSGAGKTTTACQLLLNIAKTWQVSGLLPMWFSLKDYPKLRLSSLLPISEEQMAPDSTTFDAIRKVFADMQSEGRVVYFLDGLDEVDVNQRDNLVEHLEAFFNKTNPHVRFVLTTRIDETRRHFKQLGQLSGDGATPVQCYTANSFSQSQMRDYIMSRANKNWDVMWNLIATRPVLRELAKNPLHLYIIASIIESNSKFDDNADGADTSNFNGVGGNASGFSAKNDKALDLNIINRALLYQSRFEIYLKAEAIKQNVEQMAFYNNFMRTMRDLAWQMLNEGSEGSVNVEALGAVADRLQTYKQVASNLSLLTFFTDADGIERVSFAHESFFCFFAAQRLKFVELSSKQTASKQTANQQDSNQLSHVAQVLNDYIVKPNRPEILRMLVELQVLDEHPKAMQQVLTTYLDLKSDDTSRTYNRGLETLAAILSTLPCHQMPQWETIGNADASVVRQSQQLAVGQQRRRAITPLTLFNALATNALNDIRMRYDAAIAQLRSQGEPFTDPLLTDANSKLFKSLNQLFVMIARSSSYELIDMLFTPYWLRLWALRDDECCEFEGVPCLMSTQSDNERRRVLVNCLTRNLSQPLFFHKRIFAILSTMTTLRFRLSVSNLLSAVSSQWSRFDDVTLTEFYDMLVANRATIPFADDYALQALMSMSDPQWIETAETMVDGSKALRLAKDAVNKQVDNIIANTPYSQRIFRFMLDAFRRHKPENMQIVRTHFITRLALAQLYRDEIFEYIFSDPLLIEQHRHIFDLYPLAGFTDAEVDKLQYDKDVVRLTREHTTTPGGTLPYRVSGIHQDSIYIIVPDVSESFVGRSLLLPQYTPVIAPRQYLPHQVIADSTYLNTRAVVSVCRIDGVSLPLPMSGNIRWSWTTNGEQNSSTIEYLGFHSDAYSLDIEVYPNAVKGMYQNLAKTKTIVTIDGVQCQMTRFVEDDNEQFMRVLQLKRTDALPFSMGLALISDVDGNVLQYYNNTLRTPVEYQQQFFLPTTRGTAIALQPAYYSVFGYDGDNVMLWTELTNLQPDQQLYIDGMNKHAVQVSSVAPFQGSFIEMHVEGPQAAQLPVSGVLRRPFVLGDAVADCQIPYIYAYRADNYYVLRVSNEYWVNRISADSSVIARLIASHTYTIQSIPVRIIVVNIVHHAPSTFCATLKTDKALRSLPPSGTFTARYDKGQHPQFLGHSRTLLKSTVIPTMQRVNGASPSDFIVEVADPTFRDMPADAILLLPNHSRIVRAHRLDNAPETGAVRLSLTRFDMSPLPTDNGDGKPLINAPVGNNIRNAQFMFYCPVNNTPTDSFFKINHRFLVNDIEYELGNAYEHEIRLPLPETRLAHLYYRIGNSPITQVTPDSLTIEHSRVNPYYSTVRLAVPADIPLQATGTIHFYYDPQATLPVPVEYKQLISQVELDTPYRYHADTCTILFNECRKAGIFTRPVCQLLQRHGRARMLLDAFLSDSDQVRQRKYDRQLRFNICTVVGVFRSSLILCSSLDFKVITVPVSNTTLDIGATVLLESDRRMHLVNLDNHPRLYQLGWRRGTVVHVDDADGKTDCHVRIVVGERDFDFFYHYDASQPVHLGDRLSFMPAANPHDLSLPVATQVINEGSTVRDGIVTGVRIDKQTKSCRIYVADVDRPDTYGTAIEGENTAIYSHCASLRQGDPVRYFFVNPNAKASDDKYPDIFIVLNDPLS